MHIPKTAGTSIIAAIVGNGTARLLLPRRYDAALFGDFTDWDTLSPVNRHNVMFENEIDEFKHRDFDTAVGHMSLDTFLRLRTKTIVTVLREPRARLLSHYYYWRSWSKEDHAAWGSYDRSRRAAQPFADYLADSSLLFQVDNAMSRFFLPASIGRRASPLSSTMAPVYQGILAERLKSILLVGFVEALQKFQPSLSQLLGTEVCLPHLNATKTTQPHEQKLTTDELQLIEQRSWLDAWLYDYAADLAGTSGGSKYRDDVFHDALFRLGSA